MTNHTNVPKARNWILDDFKASHQPKEIHYSKMQPLVWSLQAEKNRSPLNLRARKGRKSMLLKWPPNGLEAILRPHKSQNKITIARSNRYFCLCRPPKSLTTTTMSIKHANGFQATLRPPTNRKNTLFQDVASSLVTIGLQIRSPLNPRGIKGRKSKLLKWPQNSLEAILGPPNSQKKNTVTISNRYFCLFRPSKSLTPTSGIGPKGQFDGLQGPNLWLWEAQI